LLTFNDILRERNLEPPLLYGISHRRAFPELDPLDYLELLFQTSAHILQWREKDLSAEENRPFIRRGVELSRESDKLFLVNSLVEVGLEEGTDGVHLTSDQEVIGAREARRQAAPKQFILGKSVHSLAEAVSAESEGVDYILLGPVFDPLSKQTNRRPLGGSSLRAASRMLNTPVFALGGVDDSNFEEVFESRVTGAAGISWIQHEIDKLVGKR
jgi:thiamine-phosphate pyrophosphorylase